MKDMPDIASSTPPRTSGTLGKVGMTEIEIPIRLFDSTYGMVMVPGKADAHVSLDNPNSKGIHMSRLFLELSTILEKKHFDASTMAEILSQFLRSHHGLSNHAFLEIRYELPLKRKALKSHNMGWRSYPVKWSGHQGPEGVSITLELEITYSSTCPCSAALSRQLIQENFVRSFPRDRSLVYDDITNWLGSEQGILATPHGQRSKALIKLKGEPIPDLVSLIDQIENCLGTPVQAAVKREDEQEFARLNAANLMFAEDAARKVASQLRNTSGIQDFRVEVIHYESLHAHNATALAVKGVPGGFIA